MDFLAQSKRAAHRKEPEIIVWIDIYSEKSYVGGLQG